MDRYDAILAAAEGRALTDAETDELAELLLEEFRVRRVRRRRRAAGRRD